MRANETKFSLDLILFGQTLRQVVYDEVNLVHDAGIKGQLVLFGDFCVEDCVGGGRITNPDPGYIRAV